MIYLTLLLTFFKIGVFTFGGGYAMLPLIQEQVEAHSWLTEQEFVNFIAISESTPGPFAVNISTYVGMETGGIIGAFCATLGVVLPSFIIILIVARFFSKFQSNHLVRGGMSGLKPAVVGLIASAVISTGKTVFFPAAISLTFFSSVLFISSSIIFIGMLILSIKKVHPIIVILLSAVCGIAMGYLQCTLPK